MVVFLYFAEFYFLLCTRGPSWSWLYGSWIYNYLYNQCQSPLKLWVRIQLMARCTRYNIIWQSLSVTCGRSVVFSSFLQQRYNWNIVESDVKHHNPNVNRNFFLWKSFIATKLAIRHGIKYFQLEILPLGQCLMNYRMLWHMLNFDHFWT